VILFKPTLRAIAPLAFPLITFVPLTVIVAPAVVVVGLTVVEVTELDTFAVYVVVVGLKPGVNTPAESTRSDSLGAAEAISRVTVTVYVVEPEALPTTMVIVFDPTFKAIAPLALPLLTLVPLTVIAAPAVVVAGVTVVEATAFPTLTVYDVVVELNAEASVPAES